MDKVLALLAIYLGAGTTPPNIEQRLRDSKYSLKEYKIDFTEERYTPRVANYEVVLDPRITGGVWEGWGISLCWWAHVFGQSELLADLVFSTKVRQFQGLEVPGLGLNIARYNLGGSAWRQVDGEAMQSSPNIPAFKQMPGFWLDWHSDDPSSSSWDWRVDRKRHAMLQMAKERGVDQVELFSNSPMWWMLENHNPAGSLLGFTNNLQDWNFNNFTKYLATTVEHFATKRNISITSIEPFNEPASSYWTALGTQEGCHFDRSLQAWIIGLLAESLRERGLTTPIAASDEWKYDMAAETWRSFNISTRGQVSKVNTHGYQYAHGRRDVLRDVTQGKTLWNSEYGDGSRSGLEMAANINLDFHWLHPVAWCYWQAVDEADGWGLFHGQLRGQQPSVLSINMKFFVLAHYSRHIRPRMTIMSSGDANTIAAYDVSLRRLVLVTVNYDKAQNITYNLSKFQSVAGPVRHWTTLTSGPLSRAYAERAELYLKPEGIIQSHFDRYMIQTIEVDNIVNSSGTIDTIVI